MKRVRPEHARQAQRFSRQPPVEFDETADERERRRERDAKWEEPPEREPAMDPRSGLDD